MAHLVHFGRSQREAMVTTTAQMMGNAVPKRFQQIASPWHTVVVLALAGLNALRAAIYANHARAGLGTSRSQLYLRTIAVECAFLALVAVGLWLRGNSLQNILGERWRSQASAICIGVAWSDAAAVLSADDCNGLKRPSGKNGT